MDEVCSMQPKNMDSKYLSIVGSVYQLRENNIDIVLPLIKSIQINNLTP